MGKRSLQKLATTHKILQAATTLYTKNGFLQTSMEQISQEAGVAKGTLFIHFKSQEDLIDSVVKELLRSFVSLRVFQAQPNQTLTDLLIIHLEIIHKNEKLYTHFIRERFFLSKEANQYYITIQKIFSDFLAFAFTHAQVYTPLPHYSLFNTWIGLIHYYLENFDLFNSEKDILDTYKDDLVYNYIVLIGGAK